MIKEKELDVLITRRNKKYYMEKGYDCSNIDTKIKIKVEDININSHIIITAICEKCKTETKIRIHKYYENVNRGGYYGCKKCSRLKFKQTCINKFGVDNPMKSDIVKNKTTQTNMERYGVKTTLQSKECNPLYYMSISNKEQEIFDFIKQNYNGKIIQSDMNILDGLELDIYLPDENIAIEFDGLYWHNEINKPNRKYHLEKTEKCEEKGIQLIHIFEDEWTHKQEIVESILLNRLGKTKNKIFARKCEIKEIDVKDARFFMDKNHIQGYTSSTVKLGLYHKDDLVSVMLFTKKSVGGRISFNGYELSRFSNLKNTIVVGGANKLLKYFEKTYNPIEVRSYADRRWFNGSIYYILGFMKKHINEPSYWYVLNDERKHKSLYTKQKLKNKGFDINGKTEHEIMLSEKIYRIFDCGTISFYKKYKWKN